MKLTKCILLLACVCLMAKGFAQEHLVPGWIQLITKLDQYEGKDIKSFTVYHKRHVPEVIGPAK